MKHFIAAILLFTLVSCSKQELIAPKTASIQTSSPVSFFGTNINIVNFKAAEANNQITVSFTTSFQKNVKKLEILRGTTTNNLCSIYKTDGATGSLSTQQYATADKETASTVYYIVKYTLTNNDWGYTPMFTLANNSNASSY